MIRITDTGSTAVEIKVNGTPLQMIPAGKGIAAAGFLPEEFDLSVTVFSSVRNACGPFFSEKAEPTWCGPFQFKEQNVPFRHLVARGILGDLLISMEKI